MPDLLHAWDAFWAIPHIRAWLTGGWILYLVLLGLWIVLQLFSSIGSILGPEAEGGVAYMAHIGGFTAGFMLALVLRRRGERAPIDRGPWERY